MNFIIAIPRFHLFYQFILYEPFFISKIFLYLLPGSIKHNFNKNIPNHQTSTQIVLWKTQLEHEIKRKSIFIKHVMNTLSNK